MNSILSATWSSFCLCGKQLFVKVILLLEISTAMLEIPTEEMIELQLNH